MELRFVIIGLLLLTGCQKDPIDSVSLPGAGVAGSDGWVSSGGELFEDKQNPWWLRNTSSVGFCTRIASDFTVREERINELIRIALNYWRHEFGSADKSYFGATPVETIRYGSQNAQTAIEPLGIATQRFQAVPCADAELEFVFGEGALREPQKAYFPSLRRYVAAAVRTHYDRVHLRAKGFIYVSQAGGKWAQDWRLLRVIAHELGHVFGVRHIGPRSSIMAERFPETVLHTHLSSKNEEEDLVVDGAYTMPFAYRLPMLFGYPSKVRVHGCEFSLNPDTREIHLSNIPRELGHPFGANAGIVSGLELKPTFEPAVVLELPPEQRVFPQVRRMGIQILFGPSVFHFAAGTGLLRLNRAEIPVHMLFRGPVVWELQLTAQQGSVFKRFFDQGVKVLY